MPRSTGANLDSEAPSHHRQASLSSFPASRSSSQMSLSSRPSKSSHAYPPEADRSSTLSHKPKNASTGYISPHASLLAPPRAVPSQGTAPRRRLRSQYPRGSAANHVEYILVASFDIDRGPVMDHQYPVAITGDENMLAELMLPDQAHARNQDWTIFFLHKDTSQEEEDEVRQEKERRRARRRMRQEAAARLGAEDAAKAGDEAGVRGGLDDTLGKGREGGGEHLDDLDDDDDDDSTDSESDDMEGPPLVYVLNLVNTKHDKSVKRGAVVKAMAICTRHPFLHIYKPLLLLALEEYFKSPKPETLSMLYESVNAMDLSLMPRLSLLERNLLLASENKDLFVEKFERMIQVRMAEDRSELRPAGAVDRSRSPQFRSISRTGTKAYHEGGHSAYSVARDTHEFESKVMYKGIPIPIKVPTAVMPETVGDFSLIKLIQNFSDPHAKSPQPFALHPHLTTNGATTHPIIVLVNALLTQKKVIFLGHNMPSGEVAEAVLAACALASGGMLRGFTRHAFPYTDLTKVDDLLNVPGFIAGVTNPTFEMHPEWWDILCDLPTGRIKISSSIEMPPTPQGVLYFQQRHPSLASIASGANNITQDLTGDGAFMGDILRSMATRRGERAIRAKWRDWIMKFTRIAAQFEESVYGSSALHPSGEGHDLPIGAISGHGFVWTDDTAKYRELASNAARIEGWRNTRSYYSFIEDTSRSYNARPLKGLDLAHMHDRLRLQRLTPDQSRDIYLTLNQHIHSYDEICLLLDVAPESHAGLFYVALGLFHKDRDVRVKTADLLERVADHEAGQHWWKSLSRFQKIALKRIRKDTAAAAAAAAGAMGSVDAEGQGQGQGKAVPLLP